MQLGAKRAVDARATLLLGKGVVQDSDAHEARPRPSFRGQKAVSHVVWTQIPSIVLPPGQMAKCENCDSVHWQPQQSSVQVCEPQTGVEEVKRKWLSTHRPSSVCKARFRSFHIVCRCVFASLDSRVFWLLSLSTQIAALWFCLLCPTIGK